MIKKKDMVQKISSLSTSNLDYNNIIDFVLRVIYNRPKTEKTPGQSRYSMLFVKRKGKIRKFSDTKRLLPDTESLKMKILRANYVTLGKLLFSLFSILEYAYIEISVIVFNSALVVW